MPNDLSFTDVVREILRQHPEGLTSQQIREIVKVEYPQHVGTPSHLKNVAAGNYKDVDHAVLARIYLACRGASDITADKSRKPHLMTLLADAASGETQADDFIEGEDLAKLEADIGTLYVLSTGLYTAEQVEIVKIGITTGPVDKRISQLYTTGVPFRFTVLSQLETTNYSKLEQALHCLFDKYRINKSREFFTAHCLQFLPDLIAIHRKIEDA
ncbi:GIY-YIG nuclease family protein [Ectopseudomonas toyotomiensis]|uniref:GIY-YIG nuclease family protein n=1 Tax=Pseudomonadaceae TaxID=135621 RepID=UPI00241DA46B|nr:MULTISPECIES: GIY-YIG nuclease family protein [unclassified Pseudomonas]WFS18187.1 GIY-YIG nuclease family protein [Pseudomonas sp. 905_Psudmo1]